MRPINRHEHREGASLAWRAVNLQPSAVAIDDMLHDRKAESRSAFLPRAAFVDPVKPLG